MNSVTSIINPNKFSKTLSPYAGYICAIIAAAIYGAMAVLAKKIATDFASPMVATSFSLLFGFVITAIILARTRSLMEPMLKKNPGYSYWVLAVLQHSESPVGTWP